MIVKTKALKHYLMQIPRIINHKEKGSANNCKDQESTPNVETKDQ